MFPVWPQLCHTSTLSASSYYIIYCPASHFCNWPLHTFAFSTHYAIFYVLEIVEKNSKLIRYKEMSHIQRGLFMGTGKGCSWTSYFIYFYCVLSSYLENDYIGHKFSISLASTTPFLSVPLLCLTWFLLHIRGSI